MKGHPAAPSLAPPKSPLDWPDSLVELLPVGVCVCDRTGTVIRYNRAAAELWGRELQAGQPVKFGGAHKLYDILGDPIGEGPHPMAGVLENGQPVRNVEHIIERPDGSRIVVLVHMEAIRDQQGEIVGALNCFKDITEHRLLQAHAGDSERRLASIVESSSDAIIGMTLNGIITTWNRGAAELFGHTAGEIVGRPVSVLIPGDRLPEEKATIDRISRGERVEPYETKRRRKDGSLVDVSLTVSPIRDAARNIIGASKIARDITERRRAEERQRVLLLEMNHRIKNLFTMAGAVVSLSARSATDPQQFARTVQERLAALAQAHNLVLSPRIEEGTSAAPQPVSLHALLRGLTAPYADGAAERLRLEGDDVIVNAAVVPGLALTIHELTTNAAKYGALSNPGGYIAVETQVIADVLHLTWMEQGGPAIERAPTVEGFGTQLSNSTVEGELGGTLQRHWLPLGLVCEIAIPLERITVPTPAD